MTQNEIWKDIPGFEGLYQVSDLGRVKRLPVGKQYPSRQTHNNIRKPHIKNGYYQVNLSKENKVKWISVHRLVAITFLPNPDNLPCVNHKDENRLNNNVDNLEWCTHRYNAMYGSGRLRQKLSVKANDPNNNWAQKVLETRDRRNMSNKRKAVYQMDLRGNVLNKFVSISEAARQTNSNISSISNCCTHKRVSAKGFKWEYYYE